MERTSAFQACCNPNNPWIKSKRCCGALILIEQPLLVYLICFAFIIFFCVWMGMSFWFAIVYLLLFYVIAVTITRIRAESGLPVHNFEGIDFWTNLPLVFGFRNLGNRNLASSMVFKWAETGDLNFHPMPHQLEGFKMVNQVHANRRHFMIAMLIAVVLSCLYSIQIGSRKLGFNSLKIIGSDML